MEVWLFAWLSENPCSLLPGHNWKLVTQPRLWLERRIKNDAQVMRCDQILVKKKGGLHGDKAHLPSPPGETGLAIVLLQPAQDKRSFLKARTLLMELTILV